jgi:uncharacterized membrane protein YgcG
MPEHLKWDDPRWRWGDGHRWDQILPDMPDELSGQSQPTQKGINGMEYWEVTKKRAQISLPIWETHTPTLTIGELESSDLETMVDGYEALVQARTGAQDVFDAANRAVAKSLLIMKTLSVKVATIIEAQLSEDEDIMDDVDDVQRIAPKSEGTILKRARMLYPVWVRANAALAALPEPQGPITRPIEGVAHTALMLKGHLDGFTNLVKTMRDAKSALKVKKSDLAKHDKAVDQFDQALVQEREGGRGAGFGFGGGPGGCADGGGDAGAGGD